MTAERRSKDFAHWIIFNTQEVQTLGACRRYKGRVLNLDELYDAWEESKKETLKKF